MATDLKYQPLAKYKHLDEKHRNDTLRQTLMTEKQRFHPWSEDGLQLNKLDWINAYLVANIYGYNFDNILRYLIAQARVKTDYLIFEINPRHPRNTQTAPAEFKQTMQKYGHRPKLTEKDLNWLKSLEYVGGFCTPGEFLNAIAHQLVTNHKVQLFIDQTDTAQKKWNLLAENNITADYPKIPVMYAEFSDQGTLILDPNDQLKDDKNEK